MQICSCWLGLVCTGQHLRPQPHSTLLFRPQTRATLNRTLLVPWRRVRVLLGLVLVTQASTLSEFRRACHVRHLFLGWLFSRAITRQPNERGQQEAQLEPEPDNNNNNNKQKQAEANVCNMINCHKLLMSLVIEWAAFGLVRFGSRLESKQNNNDENKRVRRYKLQYLSIESRSAGSESKCALPRVLSTRPLPDGISLILPEPQSSGK